MAGTARCSVCMALVRTNGLTGKVSRHTNGKGKRCAGSGSAAR
jgi:hypothetical protein